MRHGPFALFLSPSHQEITLPHLKLSYFDMHGGRGEPVRLALAIGGVPFEDHRFSFPEFAEVRKTAPFSPT